MRVLPRRFFLRPAPEVARDLLGAVIVSRVGRRRVSGVIIETEAYLGFDDPASHGYRGRRHRQNEGLYAAAGTWYVYLSYGMHWCANLTCGAPGVGAAVLLRGMWPLDGVELMVRRRGGRRQAIADGPGKLTQALAITRSLDRQVMARSPVLVLASSAGSGRIEVTPRIGITKAVDWPLRYLLRRSRPP